MPRIEWRPHARDDLAAVLTYIAGHDPGAALALLEQIEARAGRLADNPRAGRKGRVNGTRELVVRPNYVVIYAETEAVITILRVLHAARQWP